MISTVSITIVGLPTQQFVTELRTVNQMTNAFSQAQMPDENAHSFTVTPETATVVITGINSLAVLVHSILILLGRRKGGVVRIVGSSGRTLEFPKDTPPEKIRDLLEAVHDLDAKRILVSASDGPGVQV